MYEFAETETRFFIITELCKGGELYERIIDKN